MLGTAVGLHVKLGECRSTVLLRSSSMGPARQIELLLYDIFLIIVSTINIIVYCYISLFYILFLLV